jgi:hypothetical protein
MSEDSEDVLATFSRGERGEVRLARCSYRGAVFTKFQLWYPGSDGELHPGRQVVTIRDGELDEVIATLTCLKHELDGRRGPPPTQRRGTNRARADLDAEDREDLF